MINLNRLMVQFVRHVYLPFQEVQVDDLFTALSALGCNIWLLLGLIGLPLFFFCGLAMIWSIASIGAIRKTMSTVFFCCLFPPLFLSVVVAGSKALGTIGALLSLVGGTVVIPVLILGSLYYFTLFEYVPKFIAEQRRLAVAANTERRDITLGELLVAVIVFFLSLPTTGLLVAVLTILKAPFVFIAVTTKAMISAISTIFGQITNGCCCFISMIIFPIGFGIFIVLECFFIILSIIGKILLAGLWPAYVASGWIRSFESRRRDQSSFNPLTSMKQACIASSQVIWLSDAITNLAMCYGWRTLCMTSNRRNNDPQEVDFNRLRLEIEEFASGTRRELSQEIQNLSMFPNPTMIGILSFDNDWEFDPIQIRANERNAVLTIARRINADPNVLGKIWNSLFEHMKRLGKIYIDSQLLTKDYLLEMPPAAIIGLPQLALLRCVERTLNYQDDGRENLNEANVKRLILDLSKSDQDFPEYIPVEGTSLMASSNSSSFSSRMNVEAFEVNESNRPKGHAFVNDVWKKMMEIKKLYPLEEYKHLPNFPEGDVENNRRTSHTSRTTRTTSTTTNTTPTKISSSEIENEKAIFEAIILSAGESFDFLPSEFQTFFDVHGISKELDFDTEFFDQSERRKKLRKIRNLLNDVVLNVTKQQRYKDFMMTKVIHPLTRSEG